MVSIIDIINLVSVSNLAINRTRALSTTLKTVICINCLKPNRKLLKPIKK